MKKLLLIMALLICSGCTSIYNHNRVKRDIVQDRMESYGAEEIISDNDCMARGIDETGAVIGVNIMDLNGVKGWVETFKAAPVTTICGICVDVATAYFTIKGIADTYKNNKITAECPR